MLLLSQKFLIYFTVFLYLMSEISDLFKVLLYHISEISDCIECVLTVNGMRSKTFNDSSTLSGLSVHPSSGNNSATLREYAEIQVFYIKYFFNPNALLL